MKTFSKIYIMLVFSVKFRKSMLPRGWRSELHSFIGAMVNEYGKGSCSIKVGGTDDHVHVLCTLSPNIAIKDLVREIKSRSSNWINENKNSSWIKFQWQEGYGAFSYSASSIDKVISYIENQEQHHNKIPFTEEIRQLLEKYNLVSEPKDLPHAPI